MSHRLADDRERNVPVLGDGSPPVTGDVVRQGYVQSQSHTQLFQFVIYQMRRILVLPAGVGIHVPDYRQQIRSPVRIVFVDNFLHGFFPFDEQLLSRFLPAIREYAVLQVFLLQISHVDKGHSPGVERKHEDVAGEIHRREQRQVHIPDSADDFQRYRPLDRFADARVNVLERIALYRHSLFDSTVVNGTQPPHIVGRGIRAYAPRFEISFVFDHQVGIHLIPRHLDISAETPEAVQDGRVAFARADFPDLSQLPGKAPCEREKAAGIRRRKIACRHISGSIAFARMLQPGDNAFQTGFVVRYPALQCDKVSVPGAGDITIDGMDISEYKNDDIRHAISYVPQNIELFSKSIYDNIRVTRQSATLDEVKEAAKAADAHEFIKRLPMQYYTYLEEAGNGLSGGEKQRIALARAFLKENQFYIMDESTSNLDFATENIIFDMIYNKFRKKTMLIIAHRLATVKNCDKIIVMDKGKIVEQGTHQQLLERKEQYYRLWEMQQGNFVIKEDSDKDEHLAENFDDEGVMSYT